MDTKTYDLLFEDDQILVVNKQSPLPVQNTQKGGEILVPGVFVVHRIDRPATGVVLFAKTKEAAALLGKQFLERKVEKQYWAVTARKPEPPSGTLVHYITVNTKIFKSFASIEKSKKGKKAELAYKAAVSSDNYHLLEIDLFTGRQHQIRCQLSAIGCPIKGDVKYGARRPNKNRLIHLHARKLSFTHPRTKEKMTFTAPPPQEPLWDFFISALGETDEY